MKKASDVNFLNKKVVLRAGFDVPVEEGKVVESARIENGIKTIRKILNDKPALLVIISHLGRPEGKINQDFSNRPVAEKLAQLGGFPVVLINEIEELEHLTKTTENDPNRVYFLENIRFWPEEESGDNKELAERIGVLFDVYVNDAFSVAHRDHMSITSIPKYTKDKCAGLLFAEEIEHLTKARDHFESPATAIIGGAKIETKLPVIDNLVKNYDTILVGGKIAVEALDEKKSFPEKVVLPVDFGPVGRESERLDIGEKAIENFKKIIKDSKTIVWNGPMGKFEEEGCESGSKEILSAIRENKNAFRVLGGGETLEVMNRFGSIDDFDYVSMSGGAMLDFMAGKKLPGIEALEK